MNCPYKRPTGYFPQKPQCALYSQQKGRALENSVVLRTLEFTEKY